MGFNRAHDNSMGFKWALSSGTLTIAAPIAMEVDLLFANFVIEFTGGYVVIYIYTLTIIINME